MKEVRRDSFGIVVTLIFPSAIRSSNCLVGVCSATQFIWWGHPHPGIKVTKELFGGLIKSVWQGDIRTNLKGRWSHIKLVFITTHKLTECWSSAVSFYTYFSRCHLCGIASWTWLSWSRLSWSWLSWHWLSWHWLSWSRLSWLFTTWGTTHR